MSLRTIFYGGAISTDSLEMNRIPRGNVDIVITATFLLVFLTIVIKKRIAKNDTYARIPRCDWLISLVAFARVFFSSLLHYPFELYVTISSASNLRERDYLKAIRLSIRIIPSSSARAIS